MRKTTVVVVKHVRQQNHPERAEQLNWRLDRDRNRRINPRLRTPDGPTSEVNAAATTTVGSTNGIVVNERNSDLPENRNEQRHTRPAARR